MIFIDLKKVFDTVDHAALLDKMIFYGICGLRYKAILQSNTDSSNIKDIDISVPQGSCLGPLLFLFY